MYNNIIVFIKREYIKSLKTFQIYILQEKNYILFRYQINWLLSVNKIFTY